MKKLTLVFCFAIACQIYGQVDTLVYKNGRKDVGKYLQAVGKNVDFKIQGYPKERRIGINDIESIKIGDCAYVDLETGKIIDPCELAELNKEQEKIKIEQCNSNKETKLIILPLNNDKYGITQKYINQLNSLCYQVVNNYYALEYFKKNNITPNNLNDYDIIQMAKALKVDNVLFGDLYIIEEPFKYAPLSGESMTRSEIESAGRALRGKQDDFLQALNTGLSQLNKQENERIEKSMLGLARAAAGTYLYETIYYINPNTMKRSYVRTNKLVMKW